MQLTPEERQRIYEEERAKREARRSTYNIWLWLAVAGVFLVIFGYYAYTKYQAGNAKAAENTVTSYLQAMIDKKYDVAGTYCAKDKAGAVKEAVAAGRNIADKPAILYIKKINSVEFERMDADRNALVKASYDIEILFFRKTVHTQFSLKKQWGKWQIVGSSRSNSLGVPE